MPTHRHKSLSKWGHVHSFKCTGSDYSVGDAIVETEATVLQAWLFIMVASLGSSLVALC